MTFIRTFSGRSWLWLVNKQIIVNKSIYDTNGIKRIYKQILQLQDTFTHTLKNTERKKTQTKEWLSPKESKIKNMKQKMLCHCHCHYTHSLGDAIYALCVSAHQTPTKRESLTENSIREIFKNELRQDVFSFSFIFIFVFFCSFVL